MSLNFHSYTVAWICAKGSEVAAARVMLEKTHDPLPRASTDPNAYEFGELNRHNIVILCLPIGVYGTVSAASAVSHMRSTFPRLEYGLLVGIGGGVPSAKNDIRLGDVVVSKPDGKYGGVVQYDYGKVVQGGDLELMGVLNNPPQLLLNHMARLESDHLIKKEERILETVQRVLEENPDMKDSFSHPDEQTDLLFTSSYHHANNQVGCENCDKRKLVYRKPRGSREPSIHTGLIASANRLMKDSETRDCLAKQLGVLCFEMEAAGVMNTLPTLVIRGVCDYCDSHKNKEWQGYAALTAAAYAKLILSEIPLTHQGQELLRTHEGTGISTDQTRHLIHLFQTSNNSGTLTEDVVPKNLFQTSDNPQAAPYTQLHIVDYYQSRSQCPQFCICQCHAPRRHSLSLFDGNLGRIGITFFRSPSDKSMCTETNCARRSVCLVRTIIQLPKIFFNKIIYLAVGVYPNCRLDMSLKVIRAVPDNADIMQFAKKGQLEDVKSLINKGLASPNDVNFSWGVPLLSYAVQGLHIDLCKVLLNEGADPCVENRSNVSALDRAWEFVLSRRTNDNTASQLRSVFSLWHDSIWFEDQQFSRLHKIVLGAVDRDLKAELELSTSEINRKDAKGRTPISWASARGDLCSVQTLLSFGADPNISCDSGNNCLMRSVQSRSSECVKLLLAHGATVEPDSTLGFTSLHYAAYYQNDEAYLKPLLDLGAPIDERDKYGWTPLSCTAEYDHLRSAQVLINNGASLDIPDEIGWTAVVRAVSSNSHHVMKLLLEYGADISIISSRSESLLHVAAARGDLETMRILNASTITNLDVHMRDSDGRTAAEIMDSRALPSSDISVAFFEMLHSCEAFPCN